jgi:hypothetical protein
MEDWGYAGSWENLNFIKNLTKLPIKQCDPKTFGGYNLNYTTYDNTSLRTMVYLVETADMKKPWESDLGSDEGLFDLSK